MLRKFLVAAFGVLPSLVLAAETDGLKNESELGMVLTGGNTDITTVSIKQTDAYTSGVHTYKFGLNYLQSSDSGTEQALTWGLGVRYERVLSDLWSLYLGQLIESNRYQNILQRYATDVGGKYVFYNEETFKLFGELGYRYARENYTRTSSEDIHFARLFSEAQYLFSSKSIAKLWVELLPKLNDLNAFQFNAELSLTAVLSDIFSIKSAFLLKLNNKPPEDTLSKTDSTFTTSLVAKF